MISALLYITLQIRRRMEALQDRHHKRVEVATLPSTTMCMPCEITSKWINSHQSTTDDAGLVLHDALMYGAAGSNGRLHKAYGISA